jgi:hypothetical protein
MARAYCNLNDLNPQADALVWAAMEKNRAGGYAPPNRVVVNPALVGAVDGLLGPHGIEVAGCAGCLAWEIWFLERGEAGWPAGGGEA